MRLPAYAPRLRRAPAVFGVHVAGKARYLCRQGASPLESKLRFSFVQPPLLCRFKDYVDVRMLIQVEHRLRPAPTQEQLEAGQQPVVEVTER